jgi:hypothetical protein
MTPSTRRGLIALILGWTFVVTSARAIRAPNDFAEAHWLLDYRFGFMKRGLIGSLCSTLTTLARTEMNPQLILALSLVLFYGTLAAMAVFLWRSTRHVTSIVGLLTVGLIFAASPFVVMQAHLLGYFDALLYMLAIAAVLLTLSNRPLLASGVSVLAILTHESYLLLGLPLVFLASVAVVGASPDRKGWARYAVALAIPVLAFLAVAVFQAVVTDSVCLRQQLAEHLSGSGFVPTKSRGVAAWQTTTLMHFFRRHHSEFAARLMNPFIWVFIGPSLVSLLVSMHVCYRIRAFGPFSLLLLSIVCVPLSLHAVACDAVRIATYTLGNAFVAFCILARTRVASDADAVVLLLGLPVLLINAFHRVPLMDGEVERLSAATRALVYLPAFLLLLALVAGRLLPRPMSEFKQGWLRDR